MTAPAIREVRAYAIEDDLFRHTFDFDMGSIRCRIWFDSPGIALEGELTHKATKYAQMFAKLAGEEVTGRPPLPRGVDISRYVEIE